MTEPLTPSDLDLRGFTYMPLEVVRLRDSDLVVLASGDEFRAAVLLWCAAWHQVPAASLPKDERMLANLAGFGRDLKGWRGVADAALRGFIECTDGRLYHPVIAEKAIESGTKKRKQTSQTAAATEARRAAKAERDEAAAEAERQRNVNVTSDVPKPEPERNEVQGIGMDRKGEDSNRITKEREPLSVLDSRAEKDRPTPIDSNYQPSDAAIEYAYSLKMKKTDLTSELSKFCADGMTKRAVSFDIDASFKKWCDQWLDYQRRKNPKVFEAPVDPVSFTPANWDGWVKIWLQDNARWPRGVGNSPDAPSCRCPADILVANGIDPDTRKLFSRMQFVEVGTVEMSAHTQSRIEHRLKPLAIRVVMIDGVEKTGAYCDRRIPPGYDEATGERIPPTTEENAA